MMPAIAPPLNPLLGLVEFGFFVGARVGDRVGALGFPGEDVTGEFVVPGASVNVGDSVEPGTGVGASVEAGGFVAEGSSTGDSVDSGVGEVVAGACVEAGGFVAEGSSMGDPVEGVSSVVGEFVSVVGAFVVDVGELVVDAGVFVGGDVATTGAFVGATVGFGVICRTETESTTGTFNEFDPVMLTVFLTRVQEASSYI